MSSIDNGVNQALSVRLTVSVGGCLLGVSNIHSKTGESEDAGGAAVTAAMNLDQRQLTRAEQVEHLRRKMAAVSSKVGGGRRGAAPSNDQLPASETLLPVPE